MSKRNYRGVIFDWDGTLMNSEARIVAAIQYAAAQNNLPVLSDHDSKQIIGLSLQNAVAHLYPSIADDVIAIQTVSEAYTEHFLHQSQVPMTPFPFAGELLEALLDEGYKLAVATGKSRRGLDEVLKLTGFGRFFDITRTPVESASKPNPLMLEQIMTHWNWSVEQVVMVGDTTFDMEMAANIGMDRIALHHGVHHPAQLAAFNPVAALEDLGALRHYLLS